MYNAITEKNLNFAFYKIQSNNLNLDYPNILAKQTGFCCPKLYFSSLI